VGIAGRTAERGLPLPDRSQFGISAAWKATQFSDGSDHRLRSRRTGPAGALPAELQSLSTPLAGHSDRSQWPRTL